MKNIVKLIAVFAVAGTCGLITLSAASAQQGTLITNQAGASVGELNVTADVAPSAILYLNTGGYIDQDTNGGGVAQQIGTSNPYTTVAFSGHQGDGVLSTSLGDAAEVATPIYVSLFLSTQSTAAVNLQVTNSDFAYAGSGISNAISIIPLVDLTWVTGGTGSTPELDDDTTTNAGTGAWVASGIGSTSPTTVLAATGSGVYKAEQTYSLVVPYGTPAGQYTGTITYSVTAF